MYDSNTLIYMRLTYGGTGVLYLQLIHTTHAGRPWYSHCTGACLKMTRVYHSGVLPPWRDRGHERMEKWGTQRSRAIAALVAWFIRRNSNPLLYLALSRRSLWSGLPAVQVHTYRTNIPFSCTPCRSRLHSGDIGDFAWSEPFKYSWIRATIPYSSSISIILFYLIFFLLFLLPSKYSCTVSTSIASLTYVYVLASLRLSWPQANSCPLQTHRNALDERRGLIHVLRGWDGGRNTSVTKAKKGTIEQWMAYLINWWSTSINICYFQKWSTNYSFYKKKKTGESENI